MGYGTWAEYVKQEFGVSKARSYQLLDHSYMVKELEQTTGKSTMVDFPEGATREFRVPKSPGAEYVRHELRGK